MQILKWPYGAQNNTRWIQQALDGEFDAVLFLKEIEKSVSVHYTANLMLFTALSRGEKFNINS